MTWRVTTALLGVSVVAVSLAVAAARAPRGDHGDRNDAAPAPGVKPPVAVPAPKNAPAAPAKKKRVQLDPELATALYRVGLQPENLTAGGVSSNSAGGVATAVKTWLAQNPTAIADADTRYFNAVTNRDTLVRKVQSGLAGKDEIAACQSAMSEFTAAMANRASVLDSVFAAGTAGISSDVASSLSRIRANQAAWDVPLQYLVVNRSEPDWVHVGDALANERISAKAGVNPDADDQSYLSQVRADTAVSAAKINLDTNLGAVQAAWEAVVAVQ